MKSQLFLGNNLDVLKDLESNSIDSIVTDPPYGISFMNKKWDYDVPSVKFWKECLRVLKPGGHALVACGTRTQHRMAINLEDAGFEIRDIVAWVYGSGFPKSLNIGKAIDEKEGNIREVVGSRVAHDIRGNALMEARCPEIKKEKSRINVNITRGSSEWEGWGTALKPAMELWTLCRKPLSENTVAENVLKYGTGGINVDECRIETQDKIASVSGGMKRRNAKLKEQGFRPYSKGFENQDKEEWTQNSKGRFPANLIHDGSEEVLELFPNTKSGDNCVRTKEGSFVEHGGLGKAGDVQITYGDEGSASRFFYCAKASSTERNLGLDGFEEKRPDERSEKGMGSFDIKGVRPQQNHHPTVKPVNLMKYLCRLITPKGGKVLDPFMGSGTTGIAAKLESFAFIGIELDPEFFEIAKHRIQHYKDPEEEMEILKKKSETMLSLFKKKEK